MCHVYCFFFKQKTAYELRISDWSSDVCSSDLLQRADHHQDPDQRGHEADSPVAVEAQGPTTFAAAGDEHHRDQVAGTHHEQTAAEEPAARHRPPPRRLQTPAAVVHQHVHDPHRPPATPAPAPPPPPHPPPP